MKKHLLGTFILIIFGFSVSAQPGKIDLSYCSSYINLFGNGNEANSSILTSTIQSNGKIIIGGDFTSYNGTVINRIARLNADGSLDSTFNSGIGANSTILSTCLQSDGKIIIAGDFISYNGIPINKIARLNIDGSLDNTFNPGVGITGSSNIKTTTIQNDGKIIIGGNFTTYNGITINSFARLNTDGTLDTTFNAGTVINLSINSITIQSDGKIIIGGQSSTSAAVLRRLNIDGSLDTTFNYATSGEVKKISIQNDGKIIIGGDFNKKIVRLNANGSLDYTFNPGVGANNSIQTICIQNDDKIIVGGDFTSYNGTVINRIARLNADGSLDSTFNNGTNSTEANNAIKTTSIQSNGKIIIGGYFTTYNNSPKKFIASLNADGTGDDSFSQIGAFGVVGTTSIQSDGKLIITGSFGYYNGTLSNGLARLNNNGTLDSTFISGDGVKGLIQSTCIQSDGKIIITGTFISYDGTLINGIARLNPNGSLDSTFNPGTGPNGVILTTSIQSNGKIIIGGDFTSYNGIAVNRIARLNYDGSLDNTFNAGIVSINNGQVRTIAIQSDGKIIIGGVLPWFGKNIVRLSANGDLDFTFNTPNINGYAGKIYIQSDGKIIIGGSFSNYSGSGINKIVRLDTNGSYDSNFFGGGSRLNVTDNINTISIQSDGKIIIGGSFTSYGGITIPNIVRLTTYGALDNSFNPGTGPDNAVTSTSIQTDGKIIVGGAFFSYDGIERNGITRVNGNNTLTNSSFDKSSIAIYPNPSNGIYTLQTNEMNTAKSISIYTILGQKIYDAVISSNETTIDISNQPKGVYLYKVFGKEGETKSGKLVIE